MALQLLLLASIVLLVLGGGDLLKLPDPPKGGMPLAEALKVRRTTRVFDPSGPSLAQTAAFLWAAQGVNRPDGHRTVPSAGATYPLELYLVTEGSRDLPRGTYRYLSKTHQLQLLGDHGVGVLFRGVALQNWVKSAPAMVIVAAMGARTLPRYGDHSTRYIHMEAGACAQSLALQAAALGLGSGTVGAFDEDAVRRVLALPAEEQPLLLLPVGSPRD